MSNGTIAYLTGEYPKVSHTFIEREIQGLRDHGWTVEACTVRRANPKDVVGSRQKLEEQNTFCILESAKRPAVLLGSHFELASKSPKRWFAAAKLAWKTRPAGLKAALWQLFYFLEAGVLAQHIKRKGVQALHNHFGDSSGTVTMLTAEMTGIPFSITLHGPTIFFEPHWWRLDEKIARAAFVSCISHFCRSQAMYFSNEDRWNRLKIVHCGVEISKYGNKEREKRGQNVIFVGRLDPVKGVPLLLDAFLAVSGSHPEATLTIVGDGPSRSSLQEKAKSLGDRVSFLGYKPASEVGELLENADILVLPSFAEGVPVVLMEAMCSRIPVIASRVAGVGELVEDGTSGFTIPAGDLQTLIDRLGQLLSDPKLREVMGVAGRRKIEQEFDLAKETYWLSQIFSEVTNGKPFDPSSIGLRPKNGSE